jgi:nitrogenase molybdenum-iron protein beta chain
MASLALGPTATWAAMDALQSKCSVPGQWLELPIGLQATDRFINTLRTLAGVEVPDSITDDRGRLLDLISDMHQYVAGKRVALFGDPDQMVALTEFLNMLDMKPVYIVTGTPATTNQSYPLFEARIRESLGGNVPEAKIRAGAQADMYLLHSWIKQESVDLLIGNTYGKYIARDEDIPFVRFGFPVMDRVGHSYFPTVGYKGAMRLLEKILGVIMDRQDRDAPEERFELVM